MGEYVVDSAFVYLGGHDFTQDINTWNCNSAFETLDKTTFRNNGARKFKGGLFTTQLGMAGFTDLDLYGSDIELWGGQKNKTPQVATAGNLEAEGQPCVFTRALVPTFNPLGGGQVGVLSAFSMTGTGTDQYGAIRATLLAAMQTKTATGALGTAVQLGAVGSTQHLFASLHLLGEPGTSITVVIESDDNSGFTSATTRGTFGPLTAAGGNWLTPVSGSITDTWWRFRITAISGTWVVGGAAAIE